MVNCVWFNKITHHYTVSYSGENVTDIISYNGKSSYKNHHKAIDY